MRGYRKSARSWLLLSLSILPGGASLSGCSTIQAQSRVDPQTIAVYPHGSSSSPDKYCPAKLAYDEHEGAINIDCFAFPNDPPATQTAYQQAANETNGAYRNRLAAILLKHSDDVCTLEMGRLTANEATANVSLSFMATTFAAASTIVTGKTAKDILSGLSGTASATKSHVNAEVYRNTLSTAIGRAIRLNREKQQAALLANFRKPNAEYSVDQMIMDVNAYHQTCSFYYGLSLVVEAVDRTKFDAEDRRRAMGVAIDDLDNRITNLDGRLKSTTLDPQDRAAINQQVTELRNLQTSLIKDRASITSVSQEASSSKTGQ